MGRQITLVFAFDFMYTVESFSISPRSIFATRTIKTISARVQGGENITLFITPTYGHLRHSHTQTSIRTFE